MEAAAKEEPVKMDEKVYERQRVEKGVDRTLTLKTPGAISSLPFAGARV
jgi:hypothetical protein